MVKQTYVHCDQKNKVGYFYEGDTPLSYWFKLGKVDNRTMQFDNRVIGLG
jgi:hypothetical protein